MNIVTVYKTYKDKKIPKKEKAKIGKQLTLFKRYFSSLPEVLKSVSIIETKLNEKE